MSGEGMSVEQLIAICRDPETRKERLRSVTKETIAEILSSLSQDDATILTQQTPEDLGRCISALAHEIKDMKKSFETMTSVIQRMESMSKELQDIRKENTELKEKLKQQGTVLKHHQTFMERIDMKERGCNLIITGIPEDREDSQNDATNVRSILTELETNTDSDVKIIKRLGAKEGQTNNRPILVEMTSIQERNRIVDAARGNTAERLRGIRIKKDTHPSVRAEWRRLRQKKQKRRSPQMQDVKSHST
jgi:hypothetical protein